MKSRKLCLILAFVCSTAEGMQSEHGVPNMSPDAPSNRTTYGESPTRPRSFSLVLKEAEAKQKGLDLVITATMTNLSKAPIPYEGDLDFRPVVRKDGKEQPRTKYFSRLLGDPEKEDTVDTLSPSRFVDFLEPTRVLKIQFELKKYYDLNATGDYTIFIERFDPVSQVMIRSNSLHISLK